MKLFKKMRMQDTEQSTYMRHANLDDLKAALAEHGYRAVRHINMPDPVVTLEEPDCEAIHEALLRSSKEVVPSINQLKHWLAEHGMVALPAEPCQRILYAGWGEHYQLATDAGKYSARSDYKTMIKAAEEG